MILDTSIISRKGSSTKAEENRASSDPHAGVWVAPQHFQPEPGWYDDFYNLIAKEPDWIDGVCFAPWEQHEIMEMRDKLPEPC